MHGLWAPLIVLAADARTGVCVTGQARSFALFGVRRSLRKLLDTLPGPVLVHMILARQTTYAIPARIKARAQTRPLLRKHALELSEETLRAEFPEAREIALFNDSSCEGLPHIQNRSCCRLRRETADREAAGEKFEHNLHITKAQPGAFIQYAHVEHCVDSLLSRPEGRTISHVIRTRPDLLYVDTAPILDALHNATDLPIAMRRAQAFGMGKYRFMLWDWFVILPTARAREMVHSWIGHMDDECSRGRARYAYDLRPESTWMEMRNRPRFGVHTLPIGLFRSPAECQCPWIWAVYPNCSRDCLAEYRELAGSPLSQ